MIVTVLNGFALAALLFSMAVGFSLIFGTMRVVNLAHGSLYLVGAVIGVRLMQDGSFSSLMLAIAFSTVAGIVLGFVLWVMLRPLKESGFFPQALLTIAVSFLAAHGLAVLQDGQPGSVRAPAPLDGTIAIANFDFPAYRLALVVFGIVLAVVLALTIERSKVGLFLQAAIEDAPMAQAVGISATAITAGVFCLGSVLAVLGGALGAPLMGAATGTDAKVLILALVVVVLGGLGSVAGAAIGSVVVGLLQTVGVALFPDLTPYMLFGVMLAVLAVRPAGLLGKAHDDAESVVTATRAVRRSWSPQPSSRRGLLAGLAALVVLAAVPLMLEPFYTSEVGLILAFGALAVTFDMVLGIAGMAMFAHVAYFGLGAYLTTRVANDGMSNAPVLMVVAGLAAAGAAALISWLPLRARAITFVMVTLAIGQLAQTFAENLRGLTGGTDGLSMMAIPEVLPGVPIDGVAETYWFALSAATAVFVCLRKVSSSSYGRTLRGIRDNEARMSALGYNVYVYKYTALVLTAGFAGATGAIWATNTRYVAPADLGFGALVILLMVVVVGGTGSLWGGFAGAAVVFLTRDVIAADYFGWGTVILGVVLVLVVYLAPGGIASLQLPRVGPFARRVAADPVRSADGLVNGGQSA